MLKVIKITAIKSIVTTLITSSILIGIFEFTKQKEFIGNILKAEIMVVHGKSFYKVHIYSKKYKSRELIVSHPVLFTDKVYRITTLFDYSYLTFEPANKGKNYD